MSAEVEKTTGAIPILTPGSGGIFDVKLNGNLIFSKHKLGRFPNDGEAVSYTHLTLPTNREV